MTFLHVKGHTRFHWAKKKDKEDICFGPSIFEQYETAYASFAMNNAKFVFILIVLPLISCSVDVKKKSVEIDIYVIFFLIIPELAVEFLIFWRQ